MLQRGEQVEEHIEAVQRMQDYIEEHLTERITLSKLAEISFFFAVVFLSPVC